MKKRFFTAIKKYLIVLSVLVAYLIWILITDIKFPCMIYRLTGFMCPGCGMTRMCLSLLHFDFKSAFYYNPFLFVNLPIIAVCILIPEINYVRKGKYNFHVFKYILLAEAIGFVVFGVVRNIAPVVQ